MLIETRSVRMWPNSTFAGGADVGVLQRPGRFVNAPVALAPAPSPPDGGGPDHKTVVRPAREPFRRQRQPRPAAPSQN